MAKDEDQSFPDISLKPFSMIRGAPYPISGDQLVIDNENALRNHVDILGCQFFQARNDILKELAKLGDDSEYRAKLGKTKAAKLEAFSALPKVQRDIALALAEVAMNHLIDRVAQTIGCAERNYPGGYWIEYKIESQVSKIIDTGHAGIKLKKVTKQVITGDSQVTLGSSYGRWLNTFG